VKGYIKEFKEFIAGGNMIELAVAVILAGFIGTVIKVFTEGIVLNLIAAIVGKPNFDEVARIKVADGEGVDKVTNVPNPDTYLEFGKLITAVFTLVVVGLVLFVIIKAYNKMKKPAEAVAAGPSEIDLLTEIRDSLKARG
jgi:large conductance mechanosensitive channel